MRFPRPRFTISGLLAATAVAALITFWGMLPTIRAQRFIDAVEDRDYETAEVMLTQRDQRGFSFQMVRICKSAELEPLTWDQLYRGKRRVNLWLAWGGGAGYEVTRTKVEPVAVYW